MPYDNQYNQDIANTVLMNNMRYIEYLKSQNQNILGSGMGNNASKCDCRCDPCKCERGLGMSGGSGFASGTFMDTGYEPTIGAGMSSGSKTYRKRGCGQVASMPPPENESEYPQVAVGGGKFVPDNSMPKEKMVRAVGGAKAKKSGAGWNELKRDLGSFDFNKIKDWVGLAKPPKEMKQLLSQVQMSRMPKKNAEKVVEKAQMQGIVGGKKGKMHMMPDMENSKHKGMGKSGGAGYSGGAVDGRKKRAEIVKKVMKEKGMKMIEASKYVKANNLY